ncbi:helix-turn-helix transcriptional regulator [Desulfovibrio sp. OttesenSCG-928-F20]|nr:helix-turn-helix transcriptional regulator [Desulfovibrio sp. OttesenSCG-928-M16]MDL2291397.1 helix-turn-helix transcriptional regulator [Desulfovibrio sp. OttesenSCG-928-F20]
MKTHTNHQIVTHNGIPIAAVVPYAEYLTLFDSQPNDAAEQEHIPTDAEIEMARNDEYTIPHEVMGLIIKKKMTPIRAWREHLGLTQEEIATRMEIKQSTYARMESGKVSPRTATLKKIATAMAIHYSQLDW